MHRCLAKGCRRQAGKPQRLRFRCLRNRGFPLEFSIRSTFTFRWPDDFQEVVEWQWKEKVIPYWREAARFAREHSVRKIAFEMHPGFVVYNPWTLLRLREAVGDEIGANNDLSHLFWQGCDPVEVIRFLGKQGAIYHAHMKDTAFFPENLNHYGVLNFVFTTSELDPASETFDAVGYGHSA